MRKYALVVMMLLLALLSFTPAYVKAQNPVVTITVYDPDNEPLANAKVVLYDMVGHSYENTTDENGVTMIEVPENETYLIVVKSNIYILSTVDVSGNTSVTVNASALHSAEVCSTPISVEADLVLQAFDYVSIPVNTNITVYAPSDLNITYPGEIYEFPYKYTFDKIVYDSEETNETSVVVDMVADYTVTAQYIKSFYITLEYWVAAILVVIIIVAITIAFFAAPKTARAVIEGKARRFVKRRHS